MYKYLLILKIFGLLCLLRQTKADLVSDIKESMTLKGLTHASDGEPLIASDVLDILNRLRDNYLSQPDGPSRDKELETVSELIEASKVSKENCNLEALNKMRDKMENFNNEYKFYLSSYLKHYWHDQFVLCKNWLKSTLEKDIETLSEDDQKNIALLRDTMNEEIQLKSKDDKQKRGLSFEDISLSILESGLSKIMRLNTKHSMTEYLYHHNGKTYFSQEFLRLIGRPCVRLGAKFKDSEKALDIFKTDLNIMNELDLYTVKWIENVGMCRTILANVESISTNVYNNFGRVHGNQEQQMQQFMSAMIPMILSNNGPSEKRGIPYVERPKPSYDDEPPKRVYEPEPRKKPWYDVTWGDIRMNT